MRLAVNWYIHYGKSARNFALFVKNAGQDIRFCIRPDGMIFYAGGDIMHGYLVALAQDFEDTRLPIAHGEAGIDQNTKHLVFWFCLWRETPHGRAFIEKAQAAGFWLCVDRACDGLLRDLVGTVYDFDSDCGVTGETRTPKAAGSEPVSYAKFRTRPR